MGTSIDSCTRPEYLAIELDRLLVCGISAGIGLAKEVQTQNVLSMVRKSIHRGPDGCGLCWLNHSGQLETTVNESPSDLEITLGSSIVVLGHTRLTVIDTSEASAQPFVSENRDAGLVFNGEIYNYRELRDELIATGHKFRTTGDTEVLLKAIAEWGTDVASRLRGMFAFVHFNAISREVMIGRDQFGVKPLYEWKSPDDIYFYSSEIKQFVDLPNWDPVVNETILETFLKSGITNYSSETFFRGVREVEPGSIIVWRPDGDSYVKDEHRSYLRLSDEESCFDDVLVESVALHLRSDVEVGACLSGGMDSTALVAIASELLQGEAESRKVRVFTATSKDEKLDEKTYALRVSQCLKLDHSFTSPDNGAVWNSLPDVLWAQEEPFPSASIVAQWSVFQLIGNSGIKVVLDGQGADEILGGYDDYIAARFVDLVGRGSLRDALLFYRTQKTFGRLNWSGIIRYWLAGTRLLRSGYASRLLMMRQPRFLRELLGALSTQTENIVSPIPRHTRRVSHFDNLRNHQLTHSLRMLLRFEDRNSMAMGVEARVPFVDKRVVEHCMSLSPDELISPSLTKVALFKSLRKRLEPNCWDRKDKVGFAVAQSDWIEEHHTEIEVALRRTFSSALKLGETETKRLISDLVRSRRNSALIWRLFIVSIWIDVFKVRFDSKSHSLK